MTKAIVDATMEATNGDGYVKVSPDRVEIVSSEITADDFLLILAEETKEYPLGNHTHALLRSLSRPEVLALLKEYKNNQDDLAFGALRKSMVKPQLSQEQWAIAEGGKAGPLFKMGKFVLELAGVIDDDKALGEDGASS